MEEQEAIGWEEREGGECWAQSHLPSSMPPALLSLIFILIKTTHIELQRFVGAQ